MNIPDKKRQDIQERQAHQRTACKEFPIPVTVQNKRKAVSFQDHGPCSRLVDQRPESAKTADTDTHLIVCPYRTKAPQYDMMMAAQIQEAFRRISGQPNHHIALQKFQKPRQQ